MHPQQGWTAQHTPPQQHTPQQQVSGYQAPQQPVGSQQGATEFWLDSGAALPKRRWQHQTRTLVIVGTSIAMVVFAGLAALAITVGVGQTQRFTATGAVPVDCGSWTTTANGGTISDATTVTIYGETGKRLAAAPLVRMQTSDDQCALKFTADDVDSGQTGYVVHVGDTFAQPVSGSALKQGVVLRPTA